MQWSSENGFESTCRDYEKDYQYCKCTCSHWGLQVSLLATLPFAALEFEFPPSPPPSTPTIYSQAVQIDSMLYISGQIGIDPKVHSKTGGSCCRHFFLLLFQTGKFVSDDDVLAQTEQALKNIGAILEAAGTTEQNGNVSNPAVHTENCCISGSCHFLTLF